MIGSLQEGERCGFKFLYAEEIIKSPFSPFPETIFQSLHYCIKFCEGISFIYVLKESGNHPYILHKVCFSSLPEKPIKKPPPRR